MTKFMDYSFCESVHAASGSLWHIRRIPKGGVRRFGGGIYSPSLCLKLQPAGLPVPGTDIKGHGGWDLDVEITDFHLKTNTCKECRIVLLSGWE